MKGKKKIAIIGGSYLQLPAVTKAKVLGYETHCFAWREGAVCVDVADFFYPISIVEKEEILDKCKEIGIDGIVTIASDLAVHTVNYVASRMHLIANPDEFTLVTTDKYQMRKCFTDNGIPSPKYVMVKDPNDCQLNGLEFPLIVKPTDRSGSRGVEKVNDSHQLHRAIARAIGESFTGCCIVEEYIDGWEISVESISFGGHHFVLQITDKVTTGEPYFVEIEHHQPSTLPPEIQQSIREIVPKALDALHISYGASHSEIKVSADGSIRFIEIGARMGGDFIGSDLVYLSTGYDYLAAVIQCSMGVFHQPCQPISRCSGVYFLSQETSSLLPMINCPHLYPQIVDARITDTELRQIQCSGDRSGYLIYQSDTRLNLNTNVL